ncbi:HAT family dimerization domain-containing protein [Trifolium pratense]|uniref:HAT family dimerization domain-containing protein n=1 Tax=Trifolium pratense TaxID=57577 RepID=A0A2K3L9L4_TRIPR|nr:HAT family dimerization domain-containing protein [Trifolium pratense]
MEVQKEFESNPTPSQPQSAPIDNVDSSEKDQLQPPTDNLPVAGDGNDNELTGDNDKKRKSSAVWNHFKRKVVNGNEKAICNYCSKHLTGRRTDGTNHLNQHYMRCPRRKHKDLRQTILLREQKKVDGSSNYLSNYHFDPEKSREDLARMIILHEYPLSIVDHVGFRTYSEGLQPLFKVPSRNTIKNDIIKIFQNEKGKIMGQLDKIGSRIALTTDMWTASNQKKGFMVITAHYIDDDWNMQSRILTFVYVECPHTAEALTKVMVECMMDWNIDRKLSTITLDNCSTNDCLVGMLVNKLDCSTLILDGQLFHMRCCAHILNLIAQDGLSVIGDGIEKVRDSVAFWTATPKREQTFREAARQIKIPITKKLVLDCKTRWNSTYHMLVVALEYKDVFIRLKSKPLYSSLPTTSEWEIAKQICSRLQVFSRVTEMFSENDNNANFLIGFDSFVSETDDIQSKSELDLYLEEKVLPRSATFDILGWWKTNGIKYPTLQKIAKDILAIPISTVASESAFSTGGRLLSPHRSRLHEHTLEALMCTQSWIKHEKQASIGITGLMQYLSLKDKRFQSFQDSDSDEEISENTNAELTTL